MTPPFSVRTSPHFDRLAEALTRRQPDFAARYDRAREILGHDPYNRARQHHIKKLESIPAGAGQWRLALGHFRFRYDVAGPDVVLKYCGLRREDTYRER